MPSDAAVSASPRGRLRVYLGAAPGVGKTAAMLAEGHRRAERGTDVVVAVAEDHGRAYTAAQVVGLEVVPRRVVWHRGISITDMDLDAVLARRPQVALVDELAHTNAPGGRHAKRWQDVQELLDAGIDVVTTVNVQHLESLNDVVKSVTGIAQSETVPDRVVRSAAQVELVDMTPEALRRRMSHGHIYPPAMIDTALANYFREGNLGALRELALLWVADRVEEGLERYRSAHGISETWAARERIVVALGSGAEGSLLLRRGARIAGRVAGRDLVAVHVVRSDGSLGGSTTTLAAHRLLTEDLGGTMQVVVGDDIPAAILDFARSVNGTQIVVGVSERGGLSRLWRPGIAAAVVRESGSIDVHVVTHPAVRSRRTPWRRWQPAARRLWSWTAAICVPMALAALLLPWRDALDLSTVLLIFLLGVLATALVGGVAPAVATAVLAGVAANLLYTPPIGSLTIAQPRNVFALAVFVIVGVTVATVVDRGRARARTAARERAAAQVLSALSTAVAAAADPVHAVLTQAKAAFSMTAAALYETGDRDRPGPVAVVGLDPEDPALVTPDGAAVVAPAGDHRVLALFGHPLPATDQRLVEVFAAQAVVAADRVSFVREAAEADRLRQVDAVRTAILAAVSHDLRSPLATIKAAVGSLADDEVRYSATDRSELLATAAAASDQLDAMLANLLDLSRLQTGALVPTRRPATVDEVVHRALIGIPAGAVVSDIRDDLPLIDTDIGLLERVIANLVSNAVRHSPSGSPVRLDAEVVPDEHGAHMIIVVSDRGPGVAEADRERIFAPFQRLGDVPGGAGVGLGLAVARGLAQAVDATVTASSTPGGGLTMTVAVPLAPALPPAPVASVPVTPAGSARPSPAASRTG